MTRFQAIGLLNPDADPKLIKDLLAIVDKSTAKRLPENELGDTFCPQCGWEGLEYCIREIDRGSDKDTYYCPMCGKAIRW